MKLISEGPGKRVFELMGVRDGRSYIAKLWQRGVGGTVEGSDYRMFAHNEATILRRLKGEGFPRLIEVLELDEGTVLILEKVGTTIYQAHGASIAILASAADTLAALHEQGVIHMDVKPTNIAMKEPYRNLTALIDFETSQFEGEALFHDFKTHGFSARETHHGLQAERTIDIVGLGSTITDFALRISPSRLPGTYHRQIGLYEIAGDLRCRDLVQRCLWQPGQQSAAGVAASLREAGIQRRAFTPIQAKGIDRRWLLTQSYRLMRSADHHLVGPAGRTVYHSKHTVHSGLLEPIAQGNAGIVLAQMMAGFVWNSQRHVHRPALDWLAERPVQAKAKGLFTGDAGVAVVLAMAARIFQSNSYREAAERRFANALTHQSDYDLYHGKTGVLQASIMLQALGFDNALERSLFIAKDLLENIRIEDNWIGWPAHQFQPKFGQNVGASHGTLGNIFTLACWADATGEKGLKDLCRQWLKLVFHYCRHPERGFYHRRPTPEQEPHFWRSSTEWCHGGGSFLWAALAADLVDESTRKEVQSEARAFVSRSAFASPTYCHGLAGQLELCRLLQGRDLVPETELEQRRTLLLKSLRLQLIRNNGGQFLPSEDPKTVTPDFWVGFTGPALELSLQAVHLKDSIWNPNSWQKLLTKGDAP